MTVPHPQRVSPNSQRKGRRLHQEGKIHRITGSEVWLVEGDTGTYLVPVAGPYMTCPCRHHGACSHPQGIREAIKDVLAPEQLRMPPPGASTLW